ncbi:MULTISPECIES: Hsp20/alpha crystallin family protein [unclassified Haladaptatus]|uniref:Hsp20/alpha crystallin family protein n=1 Tax=unclassified Haladaptatus TaxID=2622732 RepID=UPI00209C5AF6|nr:MULTISPECIES: Hsp20/alpha crystallin family protein [unclassified Haladaptatus]MCO8242839.1 Hsp20/alpha crystallin family protein [Haladaptatus sp. AB643]MCO8252599.1 Hsp20/alpha crystallin family protein [Haladaptatus sp. AB618]
MERYTPFEDMDRMFEQMRARMWGTSDLRQDLQSHSHGGTHLDLKEHDGEFILVADLPGFEKEEIEVSFNDDALTVAGKHEVSGDDFSRARELSERVTLPKSVEKDGIEATYRNGVLEVRLPIAEKEIDDGDRIEISD